MQTIREHLRSFVNENFLYGQGDSRLADDDSFLEQGIIDSTGVLELVQFLENQYSIRLEDDEIVPENLDSITRLVTFVERKLTTASVS